MSNESPVLIVNNPYQIALNKLEETLEKATKSLSEHRDFFKVATNYEKRKNRTTELLAKFHELINSVGSEKLNEEDREIQLAHAKVAQKELMDFENFSSTAAREKEYALENQIEVLKEAISDIKKSAQKWYAHYGNLDIDPEVLGFQYEQNPN